MSEIVSSTMSLDKLFEDMRPIIHVLKTCCPELSSSQLRRLVEQGGVTIYYPEPDGLPDFEDTPTNPRISIQIMPGMRIKVGKKQLFKIV